MLKFERNLHFGHDNISVGSRAALWTGSDVYLSVAGCVLVYMYVLFVVVVVVVVVVIVEVVVYLLLLCLLLYTIL